LIAHRRGHVRRGSEGWEVQTISHADRERLVTIEIERLSGDAQVHRNEANNDIDAEDYDEEDEKPLQFLLPPQQY
jgi:hypothetical protein